MSEQDIVDLNQWLTVAEAREVLAGKGIKLSTTYLYTLAQQYTPRPDDTPWQGQKGLKSRTIKTTPCLFRQDVEAYAAWRVQQPHRKRK
ncbi:MAG TPA: hypothetical protein PLD20_13020 [Blastocatellia bacterium]|nr:hypothetical protein [Blastocatellia bacterium]HMV87205.1 hypothetical protein [Blastocatellia bacterium]HMX25559.1 hypothetical protein [Blastocatellia bacterium]HMY70293.1 hypothetical protein [Blastocatellia bacterium]HMZ18850.1 hypothetical protein [Blastocatellia bacterium]